jgi:hypothetical protein
LPRQRIVTEAAQHSAGDEVCVRPMHAARGRRGDRRRFAFAVIFGLAGSCHNRRRSSLRIYQHVLAEKISALRKSVAGSPTLEKAHEK